MLRRRTRPGLLKCTKTSGLEPRESGVARLPQAARLRRRRHSPYARELDRSIAGRAMCVSPQRLRWQTHRPRRAARRSDTEVGRGRFSRGVLPHCSTRTRASTRLQQKGAHRLRQADLGLDGIRGRTSIWLVHGAEAIARTTRAVRILSKSLHGRRRSRGVRTLKVHVQIPLCHRCRFPLLLRRQARRNA